jgi:hypothetical protein
MNCSTCKYSAIDTITPPYSDETHEELCCHRYAPRMIHGAGAGYSDWRWPQVAPSDFCGEYLAKESEEE